ncbi:MAG: hypothetical protein D3904_18060, partial [Candidatus Electrothrix sp. EH2]|nr:hypothetical protein [Candidatus Electrothrix sp. EH2]
MLKNNTQTTPRKRWMLFLKRIVPLTVLLLIGSFVYKNIEERKTIQRIVRLNTFYTGQGAAVLSSGLKKIIEDLFYLAVQNSLMEQITRPDRENLARLAENFVNLSRIRKYYDQIRWIDESGMERVRVDYTADGPTIIAEQFLQDKRERYYVAETLKLSPGEIFVSPLDLNIEHGQIEY